MNCAQAWISFVRSLIIFVNILESNRKRKKSQTHLFSGLCSQGSAVCTTDEVAKQEHPAALQAGRLRPQLARSFVQGPLLGFSCVLICVSNDTIP